MGVRAGGGLDPIAALTKLKGSPDACHLGRDCAAVGGADSVEQLVAFANDDILRLAEVVAAAGKRAAVVYGGAVVIATRAVAAESTLVAVAVVPQKAVVAGVRVVLTPGLRHDGALLAVPVPDAPRVLQRAVGGSAVVPRVEAAVETVLPAVHAARGIVRQPEAVVLALLLNQLRSGRIRHVCTQQVTGGIDVADIIFFNHLTVNDFTKNIISNTHDNNDHEKKKPIRHFFYAKLLCFIIIIDINYQAFLFI